MEILLGPPYNRTKEQIGRMTTPEVRILLRHRDSSGKLDMDMLLAAQRERQARDEPSSDPFAELVFIRRLQGWPEYRIEKTIRVLKRGSDG